MKAFTEKEQGFILSRTRGESLRKQTIINLRNAINNLWLLNRITRKERDCLSFELDKILYKELKGGIKE